MTDRSSTRQLLCTVILVLVATTAGCFHVPWQAGSYWVEGKVVNEPPDEVAVIAYRNASIRDVEAIQTVVDGAIQQYQKKGYVQQTQTETPPPSAHYDMQVSKSEYRRINRLIERNPSITTTVVPRAETTETTIFVQKGNHTVQLWTEKVVGV